MFRTEICDILGIKYPILQGAMSGVTDARLVAAVSNAGALGVLATAYYRADEIRDEIRRTKDLTDKPFGVNLVPMGQGFSKLAELAVSEGVTIATTGRGDARTPVVKLLKEHGISEQFYIKYRNHSCKTDKAKKQYDMNALEYNAPLGKSWEELSLEYQGVPKNNTNKRDKIF